MFPSGITAGPGDIAIVFVNSDSGENQDTVDGNPGDRLATGLYVYNNGDALVEAAATAFSTVIVVVHTVGPILVEKWVDLPSVKSVVFAHLPGQEAGESLTDILFGDYSPSGHLPYSIPVAEDDYPSSVSLVGFELFQVQDTFSEGLYIDYRYLNKHSVAPRFAFGHGLSYTTFSMTSAKIMSVSPLTPTPPLRNPKGPTPVYNTAIPPASEVAYPAGFSAVWRYCKKLPLSASKMQPLTSGLVYPYLDNPESITATGKFPYPTGYTTTPQPDPPAGGSQGGKPALWDTMYTFFINITNTGSCPGKEVVMLFVQYPSDSPWDTPIIQLRAFEKTDTLAVGESEVVALAVTRKDLSVWDVVTQNWIIPVSASESFLFWIGEGTGNLSLACESLTGVCSGGRVSPVTMPV